MATNSGDPMWWNPWTGCWQQTPAYQTTCAVAPLYYGKAVTIGPGSFGPSTAELQERIRQLEERIAVLEAKP